MIKKLTDSYVVKALLLLFIPLILILWTGEVRGSISDSAYRSASNFLAVLLTMAATLFINSAITQTKWYNALLGVALIGFALTPNKYYAFRHFTFSVCVFFCIGL